MAAFSWTVLCGKDINGRLVQRKPLPIDSLQMQGMTVKSDDQRALDQAMRALAKREPHLRRALSQFGPPLSRRQPPGFATLAKTIVGQQISTKAADSIWRRLKGTLGTVNAAALSKASDTDLRTAGLSASKAKTLRALSDSVHAGDINFRTFNRRSDEDVQSTLTRVWGIGTWTAQIYLMFGMGRPDVWPAGDLALRTGWQTLTDSETRIEAADLADIAEAWRPHRSAAAVMLWHVVGQTR